MKIDPPFGIDLGTTHSACAIFLPGQATPQVASDDASQPTIASVVTPLADQPWKVGLDALLDDSARPVQSVKRRMGRDAPERPDLPNTHPEAISAAILRAVTDRLRRYLEDAHPAQNFAPTTAVITVPAYFDAPQIEATRRAGELAGLTIGALVQEPTAAAIYHCWKNDLGDATFLVYDLGGGTFDISIVRALDGEYQILAIDGDNHLGGDDFDHRLADLIRTRLIDEGYDLAATIVTEQDHQIFADLSAIARQVKEELTFSDSVALQRGAGFNDRSGHPVELNLTLYRADFEEAIDDLLDASLIACRRALTDAAARHDFRPSDIDEIFLVGGSTLVPAVARRLLEELGPTLDITADHLRGDDPITCVALGAALCAAALSPLRFYNDELTILIDDLPTRDEAYLSGRVELSSKASPPTTIAFLRPGDTITAAVEYRGDNLRFEFDEFPEDITAVELRQGDQALSDPMPIWLPRRPLDARPAPLLALTNPAVLSKDINLEVVDQGRSENFTLIAHGTHLPTTARHTLRTSDRSGALVLHLFQHHLPIHTLVLPLPEQTPPGTTVELTLRVDQSMTITASGRCGDQTFFAQVDRPEAPPELNWEEIEALLDRVDATAFGLWGVEQRRFQERVHNIRAGIRSASTQDPDRLQVLARRLEAVLDEFAPRPHRSPGIKRVRLLVDTIRKLVFAADDERLGRSRDQWRRDLQALSSEVEDAWSGDENHRWRELADQIQALYESVAQDEYLFRRRDPTQYAEILLNTNFERILSIKKGLRDFPLASDRERRSMQREELTRIQHRLARHEEQYEALQKSPIIPSLEAWARAISLLEERLQQVHTLGLPRR